MKIKNRILLAVLTIATSFSMVACTQGVTENNIIDKAGNKAAGETSASDQTNSRGAQSVLVEAEAENDVTKAMTPPEKSIVLLSTDGDLALSNTLTFNETVDFYEDAIPKLGVTQGTTTNAQDEETKLDITDKYRATIGEIDDFWQYTGQYQGKEFIVVVMGTNGEDGSRSFAFISYKPQSTQSEASEG